MEPHGCLTGFRIAAFQGIQDRPMLLDCFGGRSGQAHLVGEHHEIHRLHRMRKMSIVREFNQTPVEAPVGVDVALQGRTVRGQVETAEERAKVLDFCGTDPLRGPRRGESLQHFANLEQAGQISRRELCHEHSAPRHPLDDLFLAEPFEGIHDRRAADAHFARQAVDRNPSPRGDPARLDEFPDALVDLVVKAAVLDGRHERRGERRDDGVLGRPPFWRYTGHAGTQSAKTIGHGRFLVRDCILNSKSGYLSRAISHSESPIRVAAQLAKR